MIRLNSDIRKWIRVAFINLLLVAFLGMVMRYKIAYYLPYIDQKNFLHSHSHFAFAGWITQVLMTLLVAYVGKTTGENPFTKYKWILLANLLTAYGMLIAFALEGYGIFSTAFSTASILVSYVFAFYFWRDLNRIPNRSVTHVWFKSALIFSVISSIAPFVLAYIMANKIHNHELYLATIYFFLHFQYNGWLFFACMGLLSSLLISRGIDQAFSRKIFLLFVLSFVPAYFLSALWLPIPFIIYILVVVAALAQIVGWTVLLTKMIKLRKVIFESVPGGAKIILILSAIALSIKLILQAGSTIPNLSTLAFGFRPIVIGYLHLALLGVITLFIIGYSKMYAFFFTNRMGNWGITVFISGIIINEILLLIQGISYMNEINIPWINQFLLGAAVCMFLGLLMFNIGFKKIQNKEPYEFNITSSTTLG